MEYVIIGNSAAAIGTVEGIRSVDKDGKITIFSNEPYHTYSRPLISYYLYGKVSADKMFYRDPGFYDRFNVTTRLGVEIASISIVENTVKTADGEHIRFDRLMLATGGKPIVPPMPGRELTGVFSFIKWDDVKALAQFVSAGSKTVVIGAGLIGLKAAEALIKYQTEVSVVELADRVLSSILDGQAAAIVQAGLEKHGINFFLQNTVAEILGQNGHVTGVRLQDGRELACDQVVIAIGVSPNTDLVKSSAIEVNRGILVDNRMATNIVNIYAAGDVAEGYDTLYHQRRVLPILPNAYKQGFAAGQNMAGRPAEYRGGFAMNAIGLFDMSMITAGIIKPEGTEFTEMLNADPVTGVYKKVVLREAKIAGFIALNCVDRAGILTGLMEKEVDITPFKDHLLKPDFGYIHFSPDFRHQMLTGISEI